MRSNLHLALSSSPTHPLAQAPPHTHSPLTPELSQVPAPSTLIYPTGLAPGTGPTSFPYFKPKGSVSNQHPSAHRLRPRPGLRPRPRPSVLSSGASPRRTPSPRLRSRSRPHLLRLAQLDLQRLLQLSVLASASLLLLLHQALGLPLRLLQQLQLLQLPLLLLL